MATSDLGRDRAKDIGSGVAPVYVDAAAATALTPPAGGVGAQAGCYDTAANRNLFITSLTAAIADLAAIRAQLQAVGFIAGSTTVIGRAIARALGAGKIPANAVSVTATAVTPPVGGTGQTAGGYDSGANRDLALVSLTALHTDTEALRVQMAACNLISSGVLTAAGKARMRDIGSGRTPRLAVATDATASNPPAGGTGANAGGHSTAGNRNLFIASLTAGLVDIAALRAELVEVGIVGA